jgi:hypothetical protein
MFSRISIDPNEVYPHACEDPPGERNYQVARLVDKVIDNSQKALQIGSELFRYVTEVSASSGTGLALYAGNIELVVSAFLGGSY